MFPGDDTGPPPAEARMPPASEIESRLAGSGIHDYFVEPLARELIRNGFAEEVIPGSAVPLRLAWAIEDALKRNPDLEKAKTFFYRQLPSMIGALVDDSRVRADALAEAEMLLRDVGVSGIPAPAPDPSRAGPPSELSHEEAVRTAEALGDLGRAAERVQVPGPSDTTVGLVCSDIEYGETSDRGIYLQIEKVTGRGPVAKLLTPWGVLHVMGTSSDDRTPSPVDEATALVSFRKQLTLGEVETLPGPRSHVSRYPIHALRGVALPEPVQCAGDYRDLGAAQAQWRSVAEPIVFRPPDLPSEQQAAELAQDLSLIAAAFRDSMSQIPDAPSVRFDRIDHDGERSYAGTYLVTRELMPVSVVTPWGAIPIENGAGSSYNGSYPESWHKAGFAFLRTLNRSVEPKDDPRESSPQLMRRGVTSVNGNQLSDGEPAAYPPLMTPRDRPSLETQWRTVVGPRITLPPPRPAVTEPPLRGHIAAAAANGPEATSRRKFRIPGFGNR